MKIKNVWNHQLEKDFVVWKNQCFSEVYKNLSVPSRVSGKSAYFPVISGPTSHKGPSVKIHLNCHLLSYLKIWEGEGNKKNIFYLQVYLQSLCKKTRDKNHGSLKCSASLFFFWNCIPPSYLCLNASKSPKLPQNCGCCSSDPSNHIKSYQIIINKLRIPKKNLSPFQCSIKHAPMDYDFPPPSIHRYRVAEIIFWISSFFGSKPRALIATFSSFESISPGVVVLRFFWGDGFWKGAGRCRWFAGSSWNSIWWGREFWLWSWFWCGSLS